MILIADSGSTKTDWRIIDQKGKITQANTGGFNPFFQTIDDILQVLHEELLPQIENGVEQIYFYGAGCASDDNIKTVKEAFQCVFSHATVEVHHDLLGAARAACGHEPGIVCILGTGSNSCTYNGKDITENIPSLGYVLGDEGSGASLGKRLVTRYLNKELPSHLEKKITDRYQTSREEILDHIYKKPFPNRYLAKFSRFLYHHLKDPYIYQFVYENFEEFIHRNIKKYNHYEQYIVHFVGSIAFYFSNILRQVAAEQDVMIKNILESPIAGLTLYHKTLV